MADPNPKTEYRRGRGPYFAKVPYELQDDPRADAATIAVFAALQRFADWGGTEGAFVSDRKAAKLAGVGRTTFKVRRQRLRDLGWLEWESGQAEGTTNRYVVHMSPGQEAATTQPDAGQEGSRQTATPSLYREPEVPRPQYPERLHHGQALTHEGILTMLGEVRANGLKARERRGIKIMTVFSYWVAKMGKDPNRTQLDPQRWGHIGARLDEAQGDVSRLLYAVDGALVDDRLTQEDKGKRYHGIENIFKGNAVVERCAEQCPGYREKRPHRMVAAHEYLRD